MVIDIEKCIGCGNCVRACKDGERRAAGADYFRTWVERYHVDPDDLEHPEVDSPNGGYDGFPERDRDGDERQELLRPQALQPLRGLAVRAGLPGGRHLREPGRRRAGGQDLLPRAAATACRPAPTAAASSTRAPRPWTSARSATTASRKGLTTACCETCPTGARKLGDLKNPKDPIHEFLRDAQGAGAEAADGDGLEGLLQRPRRLGAIGAWKRSCTASRASCTRTRSSCSGAS